MFKSQNAKNGMRTNGWATFYLPKFEVKLDTKNGAIFMFKADNFFLLCNEKPRKESIQYGIFPKKICTESFEKFEKMIINIVDQINILIDFLFEMLFFSFFSKKSLPWLNMYVFHMGTKVISWGRHLLNKNNYKEVWCSL